jgi:hypothetical protein
LVIAAAFVLLMQPHCVTSTIVQEVGVHGDTASSLGPGGDSSVTLTQTFSVQALLRLLAPVEALDLRAALALIEPAAVTADDLRALARATVGPAGVPLMHYLVGLLPRLESNAAARVELAALLARLSVLGADVNAVHPNPKDPSLLYKVRREMPRLEAAVTVPV